MGMPSLSARVNSRLFRAVYPSLPRCDRAAKQLFRLANFIGLASIKMVVAIAVAIIVAAVFILKHTLSGMNKNPAWEEFDRCQSLNFVTFPKISARSER
jgi:hypothetical protein